MLPSRYFSDLTQPEIAAQFKKNPLVILPCGSVEQHGPHLPTGTDTLAANVISHAVAERMDGLVLPNTPFGVTPMHAPFEGTITLTPDTYMRLVIETCASTAKHGAKELMIVNWHEGNIPSLAIAAESLHREHGMSVLTVQACYVAEELYGHSCGGLTHGGEIEALAVLAHAPRPRASRPHRLFVRPRARPQDGQAAAHPHLPAGADRHPLDRADRLVRQPAARHRRQGPQDAQRHLRRHRQGGAGDLPAARRGAGRHRARSSNCGKSGEGGLMARLLKQSEAKKLGLPGRTSLEPVSGAIGSKVRSASPRLRCRKPGDPPRGPHLHDGFEECIYVLKGTGTTVAESGEIPIKPGDIVLIPPNEKHMTRNTGTEPLVLLCFFAEPDVSAGTTEFKSF